MNVVSLFLYSMWHIFLPGESTPILYALGMVGFSRRTVIKTALGLAISNGAVMVLLLALGIFAGENASRSSDHLANLVRGTSVVIYVSLGAYFLFQAFKVRHEEHAAVRPEMDGMIAKHPLMAGLLIGVVPSLADIGFFLIGSQLFAEKNRIWLPMGAIWLGVILSFTLVGTVISAIPVDKLRRKFKQAPRALYVAASLTLMSVSGTLGYSMWSDLYAGDPVEAASAHGAVALARPAPSADMTWKPTSAFMAKHIRKAHGILLDIGPEAQVRLGYENDAVTVDFSDSLVAQTGGNILKVLGCAAQGNCMTRAEYLNFLNSLHAYLLLNPVNQRCMAE